MINDFIKTSDFARSLFKIKDERISEIKKYGEEKNIPIITEEVLKFMIFQADYAKAKNILEIGTAIGYSGIFLAEISGKNMGEFYTLEIDEERYNIAKENFNNMLVSGEANLTDFKVGLEVDGKLLPKQIKGGTLLVETTFKIHPKK